MYKTIVMTGNTSWGMLQFRGDLMKALIERGHRIIVIANSDSSSEKITHLGATFIELNVDRKGMNPFKDLCYTFKLLAIFIKLKPHIVLSYTIKPVLYGTLAAYFARIPKRIAITTGLGYAFAQKSFVTIVASFLAKTILNFASEVWFLNEDDRKVFLKNGLIDIRKSLVIPGEGININHYYPIDNISSSGTFSLVARILWDKGVKVFVEVAHELKEKYPDLKFLLVGPLDEGNPEAISVKQLQEWSNSGVIEYLGETNDVREILSRTDCLVHPPFYREGIPRIILEANSMKIPCITTDIPGCRDVVKNGLNGFIIKPKNKEALKEAILNFVKLDPSIKKQMGEASRERMVKIYSSDIIHQTYFDRLEL